MGSVAEERATPISDVDLAVYVEDRDDFLGLVVELDEAVPDRRVDVMNLMRQPALIYYRVLATGDLIHVTDEKFYHDEKFRVMREYLDFKPMHDRILRDMERRLDDGAYGRIVEQAQATGGKSSGAGPLPEHHARRPRRRSDGPVGTSIWGYGDRSDRH
jgi:predicted nucleotidyltransferase